MMVEAYWPDSDTHYAYRKVRTSATTARIIDYGVNGLKIRKVERPVPV